jgi:hypothetical protein
MASNGYRDDPSIEDTSALWRRIHPKQVIQDRNLGRWRPSSAAFQDSSNGSPMSVMLAEIVEETGRGPREVLFAHPGYRLASIEAGLARRCEQGVARDPLPIEPAHAVVFGDKPKRIQRALAMGAIWVTVPSS